MRRSLVLLLALTVASPAYAFPKVTLYAASWCGPCSVVKTFLTSKAVPFDLVDIDADESHARFDRVNDGNAAIPLTLVGDQKVRGSNLHRLALALGLVPPPAQHGEVYGGHAASWWQAQFTTLRARLAAQKAKVAQARRSAQYRDELDALPRMERAQRQMEQAINQLEADASDCSLPRKYRAD